MFGTKTVRSEIVTGFGKADVVSVEASSVIFVGVETENTLL